jgi:LacI family transcriptional regulator
MASPPTIRNLARRLKLSPTTVSEALRGKSRVASSTTERVRAAATAAGYSYNALAGRVMSQVRTAAVGRFHGALALLDIEEHGRPPGSARFHESLAAGAVQCARRLGFSLDRFILGPTGLLPSRLNAVLATRAIEGLLVLPAFDEIHLEAVDWSRLSAIYLDRVIRHPPLHSVSGDHFGAMCDALQRLRARGYRRPGLVLQQRQDERLQHRWEGAFLASCQTGSPMQPAPILVAEAIDERSFAKWFREHRPDVVLGHGTRFLAWMHDAGASVPQIHGFVSLNAALCEVPCAAIDLQPTLIGARGAELLIGQLLRGEMGSPAVPCHTSVPANWQEGPSVRAPEAACLAAGSSESGLSESAQRLARSPTCSPRRNGRLTRPTTGSGR